MDLLSIATAFALAYFLDSGLRALFLAPKSALNRAVFLVNIDLAFWALGNLAGPWIAPASLGLAWTCVFSFSWCLFFGLALHFCLLTSKPERHIGGLARLALFGPGFALAVFFCALSLWPGLAAALNRPVFGSYGLPRLVFIAYYAIFLMAGLSVLGVGLSRSKRHTDRRRLAVLFLSMVFPFAASLLTDFLLPVLGHPAPDLAVLWCLVWAAGVRFATLRYGFIAPFRTVGDAGSLFQAFLENSRDGIVLTDEEGSIIAWNEALEEISGRPAAAVLGQPLWAVQESFRDPELSKDYPGGLKVPVTDAIAGRPGPWANRITEYPIRREGGETRWLQSSAFVIDLSGKRKAMAAILRDVTEEKLAETAQAEERKRLEIADKMEAIGTLAAGLAHDFNNILTGIKGTVSLLRLGDGQGGAASPAELAAGLDLIDGSAAKGGQLVRQLLALAGEPGGERKPVALAAALDHVVQLTRNSVDPSVTILAEAPPEGATVLAEAAQVERILVNLVINAADSMTSMRAPGEALGGKISISTARDGAFWVLAVRDEGVGIPPEALSRVFDPFFTTKSGGHSHGLGLSTVYAIAERHGGRTEVSSAPGEGSEFRVWLPAAPKA